MDNIGVYISSTLLEQEWEEVLELKNKFYNSTFYSNENKDGFNYFEDKKEFSTNLYTQSRKKVIELSTEFYKKYENTPLFNSHFNFWSHLRFNSNLQLIRYYKIKGWIDNLDNKTSINKFIFVNVDSKTANIIAFEYPNSVFITTKQKTISKKTSFSLVRKLIKVLFFGGISLFSIFNKRKDTLLLSKRNDFTKILSENGLVTEDKFMYFITKKLDKIKFDRIIDTNIYTVSGLSKYKYDHLQKNFLFKSENLLFISLFKIKFYKEVLKTRKFVNKIRKEDMTFLSVMVQNNRKGIFSELFIFWTYFFFLKRRRYKNIILSDEMSPGTNSIVRASKKLNINCIGIQHGLINENNFAYNYSNKELEIDNPFPDKLIVWGNDEYDFLAKNKEILDDTVQAKGNIILDGLKNLPPKIQNTKFTVLFATQPQPLMEQRMKSINDFVGAVLKFEPKTIKIIIRLHPREVSDYDLYQESFDKLKEYDFELDKGEELFSQINKSDVLVTSFSTVSKDAMILYKPIVLQDYLSNDTTGLIEKGVAINTINSEELYVVLNQIISKNLDFDKEMYENALSEIYASTDFEVAKEIVKLLK